MYAHFLTEEVVLLYCRQFSRTFSLHYISQVYSLVLLLASGLLMLSALIATTLYSFVAANPFLTTFSTNSYSLHLQSIITLHAHYVYCITVWLHNVSVLTG